MSPLGRSKNDAMLQTLKRSGQNILLMTVALLIALLFLEVGLRLAAVSYPLLQAADEQRGFALRPGAAGWWRHEGEAYVEINRDGLRDQEHGKAKPPSVVRIAVLGDSYAEARSVDVDATFWAEIERQLGACPALENKAVEVINFGVTDYGTAQQLLTLRNQVWAYDPDLVLLAFFAANDIRNNSSTLESKKYRPFFDIVDGRLQLDESFRDDSSYRLLSSWQGRLLMSLSDYILTLQVAREAMVRWLKGAGGAAAAKSKKTVTGVLEDGLDARAYMPPPDAAWNEAWRVTEALVGTIADEVKAKERRFLMAMISASLQVHPDQAYRRSVQEALGIEDLLYPERRLRSLATERGFDMVELAPGMQARADRDGVYFHGFANTKMGSGHWNEDGHRLAGQLLSETICERWQAMHPGAAAS